MPLSALCFCCPWGSWCVCCRLKYKSEIFLRIVTVDLLSVWQWSVFVKHHCLWKISKVQHHAVNDHRTCTVFVSRFLAYAYCLLFALISLMIMKIHEIKRQLKSTFHNLGPPVNNNHKVVCLRWLLFLRRLDIGLHLQAHELSCLNRLL